MSDENYHIEVEHPGWTIKFKNGGWLDTGHGWVSSNEPDWAYIFSTKEEAEDILLKEKWEADAEVVEAWIPMVARQERQIRELKHANILSPKKISDVRGALKEFKEQLEEMIGLLDPYK